MPVALSPRFPNFAAWILIAVIVVTVLATAPGCAGPGTGWLGTARRAGTNDATVAINLGKGASINGPVTVHTRQSTSGTDQTGLTGAKAAASAQADRVALGGSDASGDGDSAKTATTSAEAPATVEESSAVDVRAEAPAE